LGLRKTAPWGAECTTEGATERRHRGTTTDVLHKKRKGAWGPVASKKVVREEDEKKRG